MRLTGSGQARRCSAEVVILGVFLVCVPIKLSTPPSRLYFILYITIFRRPPKPLHTTWPPKRAMECPTQETRAGPGHEWQLSGPPPQVSLRLESEALLSMSLDEKLTNLLLQTAPTRSVASYWPCKRAHLQNGDETSLAELSGRFNERRNQILGTVSSTKR